MYEIEVDKNTHRWHVCLTFDICMIAWMKKVKHTTVFC